LYRVIKVPRILIYDDDPDSRSLFKRVLEYAGHDVSTANDEAGLLHALKNRFFHLAIINCRDGCGRSAGLAAQCKEINGRVKTMTVANTVCDAAVAQFFDDYLVKPAELETIESKVKELLGSDLNHG
jgi:DNA-binding NtrC family response regulator